MTSHGLADDAEAGREAAESWREAGHAWGARAVDWAYLWEPFLRPANDVVFDKTGVGQGTRLLDIGCGSGYAAMVAARRGAAVAGLDAAAGLLAIARLRTPAGDFRQGDMFHLPFADASFDVVTSFNAIWHGHDAAVVEARRVLKPGGRFGLVCWGTPKRVGHAPYFLTVAALTPQGQGEDFMALSLIGKPGVAEAMLEAAGITPVQRGVVHCTSEWPDEQVAARAMASPGFSWPALQAVGEQHLLAALAEAVAPFKLPGAGVRLTSEFNYLIGRRPHSGSGDGGIG